MQTSRQLGSIEFSGLGVSRNPGLRVAALGTVISLVLLITQN